MQSIISFSVMDKTAVLLWLVALLMGYHLFKMLYNISPFHPLSPIPGPKLAAASYIPEFWYDVVLFGRYTRKIRNMHDKYGMNVPTSKADPRAWTKPLELSRPDRPNKS